jgi:hypothetical protein
VGSIRVNHQIKWFAQLDQTIRQPFRALIMNVVITGTWMARSLWF